MSEQRKTARGATAWHPPFYDLITERAPPSTEVRTEVSLSQQPRRADMILLRREDAASRDHEARVLRGLWPLLGPVTVAELKGPTAGFRRTDLLRLVGYGVQYHELNMRDLASSSALTLALITPGPTPSLHEAIEHMDGWRMEPLGNGYARVRGAWYTTIIAFIDEVCEAERDDYLRLFSRHERQDRQAARWMSKYLDRNAMEALKDLEGYDELVERIIRVLSPEEVMSHYRPEERLAGLAPEERLAGLAPADYMRHFSVMSPQEKLQAVRTLSPEDRELLRRYLDETSR